VVLTDDSVLTFRGLHEEGPGPAWDAVLALGWPGWRGWYLERKRTERSEITAGLRAIRRHIPAWERVWEALVARGGGDDDLAAFLTFWSPPRYLLGCSQLAFRGADGPCLIRNYDLDPVLNEATVLSTRWSGTRVMGMVDGLAGLADGMNEHGLAVSLAFGGRAVVGRGFGAPVIVRYVLERAHNTEEAVEMLRAIPSHMAYNITVMDRAGRSATIFLSPDRPAIDAKRGYATNHQIGVEWAQHAQMSKTVERGERLAALDPQSTGVAQAVGAFLSGPVYSTGFRRGFGTVYTAIYDCSTLTITLVWPDGTHWSMRMGEVPSPPVLIRYAATGALRAA